MSWQPHPHRRPAWPTERTRSAGATVRLGLAALALAGMGACGDDGGAGPDAAPAPADAATFPDARIPADAAPALTWVDFAIAGCAATVPPDPGGADAGPGSATCVGQAPLTVQLAAVAPAAVDVYVWDFGDATTSDPDAGPGSSGPTPAHMYELPGTYDISLSVRGPGGSAMVRRQAAVVVTAAVLGAPCQRDAQCGESRECVCDAEAGCAAPLQTGLCSVACSADAPCAEGVCADLAAARPETPLDWQRSLCVAACGDAGACPAGLTCQELPAGDGAGWVQGCFAPGVLGAIGSACKDATGAPVPQACAGGVCLDIGARGACSAVCTDVACPGSAACASFGEGEAVCVRRCTEGAGDCASDPWLACEAPGAPGGFTITEPPSEAGYCTPRACTGPESCGPDGTCTAGYCAPR